MSVAVDILTDSKDDVLYVPSQAVKHDTNGYYVEEDDTSGVQGMASSTRKIFNASSTSNSQFASSTASSTHMRNGTGSSTQRRSQATTSSTVVAVGTTLTRVPVTIGVQSDTQTEIVTGLQEGERVITKKTTTATASASAPSITSLFRPQGQGARTGTTGAPRAQ